MDKRGGGAGYQIRAQASTVPWTRASFGHRLTRVTKVTPSGVTRGNSRSALSKLRCGRAHEQFSLTATQTGHLLRKGGGGASPTRHPCVRGQKWQGMCCSFQAAQSRCWPSMNMQQAFRDGDKLALKHRTTEHPQTYRGEGRNRAPCTLFPKGSEAKGCHMHYNSVSRAPSAEDGIAPTDSPPRTRDAPPPRAPGRNGPQTTPPPPPRASTQT